MFTKYDYSNMDMALRQALLSYARRNLIGAFASLNNRPLLGSYNGTLPGEDNSCEGEDGETLPTVIHAEDNLLRMAEFLNIDLAGSTVYVTKAPCITCYGKLEKARVAKVIYLRFFTTSCTEHLNGSIESVCMDGDHLHNLHMFPVWKTIVSERRRSLLL